jgi:hypothetical protein
MGISFFPNPTDVNRYRRLRALGRALNQKVLDTVPPRAFNAIGDAIGMRRHGTMVFETEDESSVLETVAFTIGSKMARSWYSGTPRRTRRIGERMKPTCSLRTARQCTGS